MRLKGNVLPASIAILALVVLVIAGVYLALTIKQANDITEPVTTSTPVITSNSKDSTLTVTDETADWQTYTNTKYNYSFKYPKDWTYAYPAKTTPDPIADSIAFNGITYEGQRIDVEVTKPADCSTLTDCAAKHRKSISTDQKVTQLVSAKVSNQDALTETVTRPISGQWIYYVWYLYKDGNLITIMTTAKEKDDSNTKLVFDQILTTFKFTDDEAADWQTYTNATYSFSLKHPTDWSVKDLTSSNTHITALKALYALAPTSVKEDSYFQIMISSQTMEQLLLGATTNLSENQQLIEDKPNVNKYGKTGNKITIKNTTTGHSSTTYYFELSSGNTAKVTGETTDTNANSAIANQIVSAFQFSQ